MRSFQTIVNNFKTITMMKRISIPELLHEVIEL